MKKIGRIFILLLIGIITVNGCAFAYGNNVTMYWGEPYAEVNSRKVWLNGEVLRYNRNTYVPVDDMLRACGYTLGWDAEISAVTAYKNGVLSYIITNSPVLWKGPQQYIATTDTIIYKDIFYMPIDMFKVLTDDTITVTEPGAKDKYQKRDLLLDTYISDTNRIYGDIYSYNNVSVVGNFGMMTEHPTETEIESYTKAVNLIANTTPVGVNIYNIIIPTAGEFYGPEGVYTDQTSSIKTIYNGLTERVTPINAVSTLDSHADEYIYFRTDHHWTQRGAYYAYKEFIQVKGDEPPILSDFDVNYGLFTGSLASFMSGTDGELIMKENPDVLERFVPLHYTDGAAYMDMYMTMPLYRLEAVYSNVNSYLAFIGGDNPLSVFTTDVGNGKRLLIIKESFGNAFATWALNNYSEIYVIDPRKFNNGGQSFKLSDFYNFVKYDDVVIINSVSSLGISNDLQKLVY